MAILTRLQAFRPGVIGSGMMKPFLAALICLLPLQVLADPHVPQPPGHVDWLSRQPELVFKGWSAWKTDMGLLRRVNRSINGSMVYQPEADDAWGIGADCEDFAIRKLEALLVAGVPRGALRLATARVKGQGHAVLVVRDFWVLDNLRDEPFRRDMSELKILAWETVGGKWNPAGSFASLADHLKWSRLRPRIPDTAANPHRND